LRSLSESLQGEFLETLPEDELLSVLDQLRSATVVEPAANFAEDRSARNAQAINAKTAAAQEIGPLPAVKDPDRRAKASVNNLLFAETYFPATFYLPWAPYQRAMMNRFQEIVLSGGRECHAVRRGGLKSTCARVSTLWAVVNGHRRFPVLVGATDDKADEHRENFFALMASSATLLEDYPELLPLILKWRQPKRQFRLGGRLLIVHPKDDRGRIVFPDIHDAPSCEAHIAPYSVNATDVSGLSFVDRFGVSVRPDLLVFDDVQTPQSAKSPLQTEGREDHITKTFCGLAGLGQKLAAIMVCTVREHDDLSERFLSRKRHPDWDGERYPSIIRMPERMDLWEAYAVKLSQGDTPAEGKRLAQEFYIKNREAMDAGGRVAWEEDKLPDEVSALQSLMTVRALDPSFFRCEIQQEGEAPVNTSGIKLDAQSLLTRTSGIVRGLVPDDATYTVGFIDSSDQILWAMVCSFQPDFTGAIVTYRTWPDQGRPVFYKSDLNSKISEMLPGVSWEEAFVHAHNELERELFEDFPEIDLLLKDWSDGGQMPLIRSQIAASKQRSRIRPSKGFAPKPGKKPIHLWGDQVRDRAGTGWLERRTENPMHIQFDANIIKSMAARRLLTTAGAPSSVLLPGLNEQENRLLVEHFTSEKPVEVTFDGSKGVMWSAIPGRDNDWWDCFCGCVTAASVLGCRLNGDITAKKETRTFSLPGGTRRG
jgi:hypothetical protein